MTLFFINLFDVGLIVAAILGGIYLLLVAVSFIGEQLYFNNNGWPLGIALFVVVVVFFAIALTVSGKSI